MHAPRQQQLVKNAATNSSANLMQAKSTSRQSSARKPGSRFLGFLISALGAWSV